MFLICASLFSYVVLGERNDFEASRKTVACLGDCMPKFPSPAYSECVDDCYNYRNVIEAPSRNIVFEAPRMMLRPCLEGCNPSLAGYDDCIDGCFDNYRNGRDVIEPVSRSVEPSVSRNLSSCTGLCHLYVGDFDECIRNCKAEDDRARMKAMYGGGRAEVQRKYGGDRAEERESVRQDLPLMRRCMSKCNGDEACFEECFRVHGSRSLEAPRMFEAERTQACQDDCNNRSPDRFMDCWRGCTRHGRQFE